VAQHYSNEDGPTPLDMRDGEGRSTAQLSGYEVYRFGGGELQGESGAACVRAFFEDCFGSTGCLTKPPFVSPRVGTSYTLVLQEIALDFALGTSAFLLV